MCVHMKSHRRPGNKGCPCLTDSMLVQLSLKVPRSHLALDYVSNPGSLTFMKLLAKRGPSFEQGWVESFFHVEPVWNPVALAGFHLEFHIQTTQSFRVKGRGEETQRNKTTTAQETMACPTENGMAVYHLPGPFHPGATGFIGHIGASQY